MHDAIPIDVICMHSRGGEIVPIRIRVMDEEGLYQSFTIKEYRELSHQGTYTRPDGMYVTNETLIYECKINIFGKTKLICLYYEPTRIVWKMTT